MSLQTPTLTPTRHPKLPPAPDPTASIQVEGQNPSNKNKHQTQTILHALGIPTSLQEAQAFGPKHFLLKLLSLVLIFHGIIVIYQHLFNIFYILPQVPKLYRASNFSPNIYQSLRNRTIIVVATGAIETTLGISLAAKKSDLIRNLHIISGIAFFIITLLILSQTPNLNIKQIDTNGLTFILLYSHS